MLRASTGDVIHDFDESSDAEIATGFALDGRHLYFSTWQGTVEQVPR